MLTASSMSNEDSMTSLRERRKKSPIGLHCCFLGNHNSFNDDIATTSPSSAPTPKKSPKDWIRSKAHDIPEIKHKCKSFISRMGRTRRHASGDFSYDPLSYSLNFDRHEDHAYEFCGNHLPEITTGDVEQCSVKDLSNDMLNRGCRDCRGV